MSEKKTVSVPGHRKKSAKHGAERKPYAVKAKHAGKFHAGMRRRLAGLFLCVVLAFVCLLIRVTYISATSGQRYRRVVLSNSQNRYSSQTLPYRRGNIEDRNGTVLAASEKRYHVILDCKVVNSSPDYEGPVVRALNSIFGIDEALLRSLIEEEETADSQYQVVAKNVTISEKQAFDSYRNPDDKTKAALSESELLERSNVRGVWFEEHYMRVYPFGSLAGEVIGFVYDGDKADWGIEGYYNYSLCGTDGRRYGYWDSDSELGQTIVDPVDGDTVRTTLDVNIQSICEQTLSTFEEYYGDGGSGAARAAKNVGVIVMNPNDGSIYAMASNEGFDPNNPRDLSGYYSEEQINGMSDEQKAEKLQQIWRNYCISDSFEPGSVYKPVTMAAALSVGAVTPDMEFYCDGYETVAGVRIKCSKTTGHGQETLGDLIRNSCNDGFMQVGALLGVDAFCKYQNIFNFGSRTGIDLPGEASGIVGAVDTMGSIDLATASFGQGFTCTMLQEAAAISSIINGGMYYRPHIVSKTVSAGGGVRGVQEQILMKQTVSADVANEVRSYMKDSVVSGTSRYAKVDCYSMGGKTGTAQKIPRGNGNYLVSFVGFAPTVDPKVLIYVVVDEPNVSEQADNRYPQWIARDILALVLPYLEISPDEASDPSNEYLYMDFTNQVIPDEAPEEEEKEDTGTYYYDDEGDRRNEEGHLVDQEGYLINSDSEYVDENENIIDVSQRIRAGEKVHSGADTNAVNGTGENTDVAADTNVPEPPGNGDGSSDDDNYRETDGFTNEEAGFEN